MFLHHLAERRPVWPYTVQLAKFFKVICKENFKSEAYPVQVYFDPESGAIEPFSVKYSGV